MNTSSKCIQRAFAVTMIIVALTGAGYVAFVKGPSDLAGNMVNGTLTVSNKGYELVRRIAKEIDDVIHIRPTFVSGGNTIIEASNSIAEFSTVEKPFEHTYCYESTWLGSTKRIKVKGQFIAKAGYDLNKPFTIDVSEDMQKLRAQLPPSQINSVEQLDIEIVQEESGWWNTVSTEDRQSALKALLRDAKRDVRQSTILADADRAFREQFEKIVRKNIPASSQLAFEPLP